MAIFRPQDEKANAFGGRMRKRVGATPVRAMLVASVALLAGAMAAVPGGNEGDGGAEGDGARRSPEQPV